jgi:cyclase
MTQRASIGRSSRRAVLRAALGGAAGLALAPGLARAQAQAAVETQLLAPGLTLLTGAGANVVAMTGADDTVLVDGGLAARSAQLLAAVAALPGAQPVRTLFNTHWHPEQTGSNETLGRAGATIIAHENTRLWLTTDITRPWETATHDPLPVVARPNRTFYATETFTIGDEQIDCGYLRQAHTDGDIYVFFRSANVLVAGDVVSGAGWPFIDWWTGGWIGGLPDAIDALLERVDDDTVIVPAQGGLLGRADLEFQREMHQTIYGRLRALLFSGRSPDEAIAARPTREYDERMGDPERFVRLAFQSLWGQLSPDA